MKQFKRRSILGPMGILILLLSMLAVQTSFAATGVISVDKTHIKTPDGVVKITLIDSDLDIAAAQTLETADYDAAAYSFPFTSSDDAGLTQQVRVKKFPILDNNSDGFVNFLDVAVDIADLQIYQVSSTDGLVTVKAKTGETGTAATAFKLSYKAADVQKTPSVAGAGAVKVTSTTDATGFYIVLKETGSSTGKFEATFKTGNATVNNGYDNPDNSTRPVIAAVTGAIITVSYTDASPSATRTTATTVETTKPTVSIVSPATGAATQNVNPKLIANFTDGDSTIDKASIAFVIATGGATVGTITTNTVAGGYQAETTLSGLAAGETAVTWYAQATDKAGNVGRSDSSATTTGDQNHSLSVDTVAPDFASPTGAITGQHWSTALTTTNKTETTATKALDTSIRVIFNEALDGDSVQATDFTVGGVVPAAANWYAGASDSVFLTVPAQAANAKPKIALAGAISDKAGNSRTSSATTPTAVDGIAPTVVVSVTPNLHKTTVKIEVSSNEPLLTSPTIRVNATTLAAPSLVATNTFQLTHTTATAGQKTVKVTVQDTSGNSSTKGSDTATATGAILFEIDNALPAPTSTSPANSGSVYSTSPFFTIDWTSEGSDYGTGDTHKKVTLTKVTLDGTDVLALMSTADNINFILATSSLALGVHTVVFNAKDDAGNVLATDVTSKFTVKVRPPFDVILKPGWNLISIPSDPADPAINSVISSTHPIDTVLAYDAANSVWQTASRDAATGKLAGSLTQVNSSRALWVHTSSFQKLAVTLSTPMVEGAVLPSVSLQAGWNMVSVVKVDVNAGNPTADTYLNGTKYVRAYYFDTVADKYVSVSGSGTMDAGKGYWVYVPAAATLIP